MLQCKGTSPPCCRGHLELSKTDEGTATWIRSHQGAVHLHPRSCEDRGSMWQEGSAPNRGYACIGGRRAGWRACLAEVLVGWEGDLQAEGEEGIGAEDREPHEPDCEVVDALLQQLHVRRMLVTSRLLLRLRLLHAPQRCEDPMTGALLIKPHLWCACIPAQGRRRECAQTCAEKWVTENALTSEYGRVQRAGQETSLQQRPPYAVK